MLDIVTEPMLKTRYEKYIKDLNAERAVPSMDETNTSSLLPSQRMEPALRSLQNNRMPMYQGGAPAVINNTNNKSLPDVPDSSPAQTRNHDRIFQKTIQRNLAPI